MLDENNIKASSYWLEKAERSLNNAVHDLNAGFYEGANNRAYYSVFYSMQALLGLDGVAYKKHSQVIGHINRHYINSGIIDMEYKTFIAEASYLRNASDYGADFETSEDDSRDIITNAERVLSGIKGYIVDRIKGELIEQQASQCSEDEVEGELEDEGHEPDM